MMNTQEHSAVGATEVDGLGRVYESGGTPEIVLKDCSFEIPPGTLTVVLGPSGCGKSTLINLIAGYDQPTLGETRIDGEVVRNAGSDRMVVFQETALFPWMSLIDNVAYGPIQRGDNRRAAMDEAARLLTRVGLNGFEKRYPNQVSGGMQRRAEVARAMISKPRLMLMDEPFRGLDHMSRSMMQEYYLKLFEEERLTTLFVTSEIDEAIFLADRLVILSYKPTVVKETLEVHLPRPRSYDMLAGEAYAEIKDHALKLLHDEALKAFGEPTLAVG